MMHAGRRHVVLCFMLSLLITLPAAAMSGFGDAVPPVLSAVAPLDRGNVATLGLMQPIVARVVDVGSGVDESSARATIEDVSVESAPKSIDATFTAGVLRTRPVRLQAGHNYRAVLSVRDRAGNEAVPLRISFSAIALDVPSVTAEIPSTTATHVAHTAGNTTYTFTNLPLRIPEYPIRVHGSPLHAGFGYAGQEVPLDWATLRASATNGRPIELSLRDVALTPIAPMTTYGQILALRPGQSNPPLRVGGLELTIPALSVTVPSAVIRGAKVALSMRAKTSPFVPVCADPTLSCSGSVWPSTDPFPFYVSDREASDIVSSEDAAEARTAAKIGDKLGVRQCDEIHYGNPIDDVPRMCVYLEYNELSPGVLYHALKDQVTKAWRLTAPVAPLVANKNSTAVEYSSGYPIHLPATFQSDCSVLSCSGSAAAAAAEDNRTYCETTDGGKNCQQFIYLRAMHYFGEMICDASYANCYPNRERPTFQAFIKATENLYDSYTRDEMGLWWDANATSWGDVWQDSWRGYRWPYMWDFANDACIFAGTEIYGGEAEARTTATSMSHTALWQSIGPTPDNCATRNGTVSFGRRAERALTEASLVWGLFETDYRNQPGRMEVDYGHRMTYGNPSWSCGYPSGCGFTVSPATKDSWQIEAHTNFWY